MKNTKSQVHESAFQKWSSTVSWAQEWQAEQWEMEPHSWRLGVVWQAKGKRQENPLTTLSPTSGLNAVASHHVKWLTWPSLPGSSWSWEKLSWEGEKKRIKKKVDSHFLYTSDPTCTTSLLSWDIDYSQVLMLLIFSLLSLLKLYQSPRINYIISWN